MLSSFHNQLKSMYLNEKVNRRVDFLVHRLLQYQKDAFFCYKKDRQLSPAMLKKTKEEMNYHQRGLQVSESYVQVSIMNLSKSVNYLTGHLRNLNLTSLVARAGSPVNIPYNLYKIC